MARAGAVWLSVLPDMALFGKAVATGAAVELGPAGAKAGASFGKGLQASAGASAKATAAAVTAEMEAAANTAAAAAEKASMRVVAANKREQDAIGQVRVAELRLADVRAKAEAAALQLANARMKAAGVATEADSTKLAAAEQRATDATLRLTAAEEGLDKAQRGQVIAASGAAKAATDLSRAQAGAVVAADGLAKAQERGALASDTAGSRFAGFGAKAGGAIDRVGVSAKRFIGTTAKLGLGLGAFGFAEFAAKGVKAAGDFQKSMMLLVTAGGESKSALQLVSQGVLSIAVSTGTSTQQLAEGMYIVEKAGIRGANGLHVLKAAAQGAKDENVDLATMTQALTSVMRSYNLPASDAVSITNQMVAASGEAKTTMADFAGSLSAVLPLAGRVGLSFAQVGGAIATITSHGTSAFEATQELSNTIRGLVSPNRVAINMMAQFGIQSTDVAQHLGQRGLTGTITMISDTIMKRMGPAGLAMLRVFNQSKVAGADAKTMFDSLPPAAQSAARAYETGQLSLKGWRTALKGMPAEQAALAAQWAVTQNKAQGFNSELRAGAQPALTYEAALKAMMGGATGMNTALMLTGGSAATFSRDVARIGAAGRKTGTDISTWAAMQSTFNVQLAKFKETIDVAAIRLGTALLPVLQRVMSYITGTAIPAVVGLYKGAIKPAFDFIDAHKTVFKDVTLGLLGFAVAWGTYRKASELALGAMKGFQGVSSAVAMILGRSAAAAGVDAGAKGAEAGATVAATEAQRGLNLAMRANVIGLIITGIMLLAAAFIYAYKHSATFRAIVQDALHGVLAAAKDVAKFITGPFVGFFEAAWRDIKSGVSTFVGFFTQTIPGAVTTVLNFVRAHWKLLAVIISGPLAPLVYLLTHFWSQISGIFRVAWQVIQDICSVGFKVLTTIVKVAIALIALPFVLLWAGLKIAARAFWAWAGPYITVAIRGIAAAVVSVLHGLEAAWSFVWGLIRDAAKAVWSFLGPYVHDAIAGITWYVMLQVHGLESAWRFVWGAIRDIVTTVWRIMSSILHSTWDALTGWFHGAFDRFGGWVSTVWHGIASSITGSFRGVSGGMTAIFGQIKAAVVSGVNDIISFVNRDLIGGLNWVLGKLGVGKIGSIPMITVSAPAAPTAPPRIAPGGGARAHLAAGGIVPGADTGRDYVPVMARGGEGMIVPEAVAGIGGPKAIDALNRHYSGRSGTNAPGHYLFGGIISDAWDSVKHLIATVTAKGAGFLLDHILGPAEAVAGRIPPPIMGQIAAGAVKTIGSELRGWFTSKANAAMPKPKAGGGAIPTGGGGAIPTGGGVMSKGQLGSVWIAGGGPAGVAGIAAAIADAESGGLPSAVQQGQPAYTTGWGLWQITPTSGSPGPYSRYLNASVNAQQAVNLFHGAGDSFRPWSTYNSGAYLRYMDSGGQIQPGVTQVYNGTGRPETVLPPVESDALKRIAAHSSGPTGNVYVEKMIIPDRTSADLAARKLAHELQQAGL